MNKQKNSRNKETEKLLHSITERQKELARMTNNMQSKIIREDPVEVNFDWLSRFKDNIEFVKLSKAV